MDQKFYDNDIDPDEPKCVIISPFQRRTLLGLLEVTSGDFQGDSMAFVMVTYLTSWVMIGLCQLVCYLQVPIKLTV